VREFEARSEAETVAVARALADRLRPGDTVLLAGVLGAGKTVFARAVLRALLADPDLVVPSPSFALVQPYEGGGLRCLHIDLYRLADPRDADELGLTDEADAIRLVEWPDRLPSLRESADWLVEIAPAGDPGARRLAVTALSEPAREARFATGGR
jgi:tRNA threonylcarbamoyladenosine biosynthesis protein TsaE